MRESKRKRIIFQLSSSSARRDQFLILFYSSLSLSLSLSLFRHFLQISFLRYSPSIRLFFFDVSRLPCYHRLDYTSSSSCRLTSLLRSSLHRSASLSLHLLHSLFQFGLTLRYVRLSIMLCIGFTAKILNDFLPPRNASIPP